MPAPLASLLGVEGATKFLVQHQLLSGGRNYRVLNHEKRHLFTIKENIREELTQNMFGRGALPATGLHLGREAGTPRTFVWTVDDSSGTPQAAITIQVAGNATVSTLADSSGVPVLAVNVQRSLMGGLTATAVFPDGRPMFSTQGNLLRHNFSIHDSAGSEVAKIHEAWASVRDTYNLDLSGSVDPLAPIIFAILVDREKAGE